METSINDIEYKELLFKYNSALKVLELELNILGEEFLINNNYNPIEHIKSRIKKVESIKEKLKRKNLEFNLSNIVNYINDVVGVRIVCSFENDVYDLVNLIKSVTNLIIIDEKDYIKNPKESGYSSYHLNILVPIFLSSGMEYIKSEIQIRTMAMDFWASIDHKISYKYPGELDHNIKKELIKSSKEIRNLDLKMSDLDNRLHKNNKKI